MLLQREETSHPKVSPAPPLALRTFWGAEPAGLLLPVGAGFSASCSLQAGICTLLRVGPCELLSHTWI